MPKLRTIVLWTVFGGILWLGKANMDTLHRCVEAMGAARDCRQASQADEFMRFLVVACAISVPLAYLYLMGRYGTRD